jgi:alpha-glucuronidase
MKISNRNGNKSLKIKKLVSRQIIIFAVLLFVLMVLSCVESNLPNKDGYELWMDYRPLQDKSFISEYKKYCNEITVLGQSDIIKAATVELEKGLFGLLGSKPVISNTVKKNAILVGRQNSISTALDNIEISVLNDEGFIIKNAGDNIIITGKSDIGVLYGVFHFLRLLQMNTHLAHLDVTENPAIKLRMLNHWDNPSQDPGKSTVGATHAGNSIFKWYDLPNIDPRYIDYARMLASVGTNGTVLNDVNTAKNGMEGWKLLTPEYLPKMKALAGVFRQYGIKLYISVNFFSPVLIANLDTADPLNSKVITWWNNKAAEIYSEIPDLGGFLVKADSEGEPGPMKYNRTHADGANLLANALLPFGGTVLWRAFVYGHNQTDRARQAYDIFKPLDGAFSQNALLQIKNGPLDFQVREPVSPLFGAMPQTGQMLELQITQEYTGQNKHVCYLVPQWKEILDFDTYAMGKRSTIKKIIGGRSNGTGPSGISAVSNIGQQQNWTGHLLAQANAYGFGRLAWNPDLSSEQITKEWIYQTFGHNPRVHKVISEILLTSWKSYEDYTSPLGVGMMCNKGGKRGHFFPAPATRTKYHMGDKGGVGYDRTTATGSGYINQYFPPKSSQYENIKTCPDELLLFLHHVKYTHKLKSGKTVIQHIYDSHYDGVEQVIGYKEKWLSLQGFIDSQRFEHVLSKLEEQIQYAEEWRDSINGYFYELSNIPDQMNRFGKKIVK